MPLVCLVYVSFATHPMSDAELHLILAKAREKNKRLNVTGMLLYREGFFMQALEGEKQVVDALFAIIRHDKRHHKLWVVYEQEIKERIFKSWAMGFNHIDQLSEEEEGFFELVNGMNNLQIFVERPSIARGLLERFKDRSFF